MQIKETMQRYGFTPTSLAKKMGVYASTVIRLTDGNPTVDKLDELARWIGCSRWEFFQDEIQAAGFEIVKTDNPQIDKGQINKTAAAPTEGAEQAGQAAEDANRNGVRQSAAPEAPNQQAEPVKAVRFQYQCPACGRQIKVCISEL